MSAGPEKRWTSYVRRVLESLEPGARVSKGGVEALTTFTNVLAMDIAELAPAAVKVAGMKTAMVAHVKTAFDVHLIDNELLSGVHAAAEAAVERYATGEGSASERAGTIFPSGRLQTVLRDGMRRGLDPTRPSVAYAAAVYMAGAMDQILTELLGATVRVTHAQRKKTLTAEHMGVAIAENPPIRALFEGVMKARIARRAATTDAA